MSEIKLDYPAAARSISVWLEKYCDESLEYPNMVAEAARRASKEIERLHKEIEALKAKPTLEDVCDLLKEHKCIGCSMDYQTKCKHTNSSVCARRRLMNCIWQSEKSEALRLFGEIRGVR